MESHVPGAHNPADLVSRGAFVEELGSLWFDGPEFLRRPVNEWKFGDALDDTTNERRVRETC